MRRPLTRVAALLTCAILFAACTGPLHLPGLPAAGPKPTSVVGQIAVYGRQFVIAGDAALTGLDLTIGAGIIPRETGVTVLLVMKRVGDECVRLAGVLRAIDAAKDLVAKTDALSKAKAAIAGIGILFDEAVIPIQDPKTKTIVAAILNTAKMLVADFSATLTSGATLAWNAEASAFEAGGHWLQSRATWTLVDATAGGQ